MHFEIWWAFGFVIAVVGIQAFTRIVTSIVDRGKGLPPRALEEIAEKVERISQAVDATAIEVERIGESQRFLTRVLSDKPAAQIEKQAIS